jgi:hypothetical protein
MTDDGDALEAESDALDSEDLQYPTFTFPDASVGPDGGFDAERPLDYDTMAEWLRDLAGGLGSHDIAVEGADRRVIFGIGPDDVAMSFEPDDDHRGTVEVTFTLKAKAMTVGDTDDPQAGARGGRGFVPVEMLTGDRDPSDFRCYNWIADPGETVESAANGPAETDSPDEE